MKKQISLLTVILFAVSTLMIACKIEVHTHTFSSKWTSDETNHWHAATCKHKDEVIDRAKHTFGDWTITKEPTEEAEGSREKSCSVCEYKVTEEIAKLPHTHKFETEWTSDAENHWHASICGHEVTEGKTAHTFRDWTITKEPTEEAEGSREKSCTVCEYTVPEVIEKLAHTHKFAESLTTDETHHWYAATCEHTTEVSGKAEHTFGNWTTTKEATEEAEGSKERTCTVCGYTATEAIEKLAHTHKFATEWTKDETNHWHASTCGHEVTEGKTTHTFGDWITTKAATEEETGSKERVCDVCKYIDTEVIEKLAHTHKFATDWTSDETNHWHASTCGHEVTDSKAAHTFGDWTTTKEATCTEEGNKTRTCEVCKKEVTEKIPAKGHSYSESRSKDTSGHWHACVCGAKKDFEEHTYDIWKVVQKPTASTEGTSKRECKICSFEETKQIIPIPEGFVLVEAGTFQMGSNEGYSYNKPVHEVTITKPFYMGKCEVTQAEYEVYCSYGSSSPSSSFGDGDNYPAYYVSWYDAIVYCNKRSMAEGLNPCYSISNSTDPKDWGDVPTSRDSAWDAVECYWNANGYRLPTEAEWEYAARAGDNTVDSLTYSGTINVDELGDYAWYNDSANDNAHEVGKKEANAFGLYDMSGNVFEWCWNWWISSYDEETEGGNTPTGTSAGAGRVRRGGGWYFNSDYCAVSCRDYITPFFRNNYLGFRVVRRAN